MSATRPGPGRDPTSGQAEIQVRGHLDAPSDWFEGLTLACQTAGAALIEEPVVAQAAMFGVIQWLRDKALPLISLVHIDPSAPTSYRREPEHRHRCDHHIISPKGASHDDH